MPRATIASRQLKNRESGLDLFVPEFREVKGTLQSTIYYQVVLVSNLACFKAPSHKESDIVQYSIEKRLYEFEELSKKISAQFVGTVIPPINKKSIITNHVVLRERRNSLDSLMKFLASVKKIATCTVLLEFLGVDSVRAKKFSRGEPLDEVQTSPSDFTAEGAQEKDEMVDFGDDAVEDEAEDDLFSGGSKDKENRDMFASEVQMFDRQDLKPDLNEEDEKAFGFIPDAIITKKETVKVGLDDEDEENSDLFQIEDDLDQLMAVDVKKKEETSHPLLSQPEKDQRTFAQTHVKPLPKPKPSLKPSIPAKPSATTGSVEGKGDHSQSSHQAQADRPKPAPRTKVPKAEGTPEMGNSEVGDNLDQDDIMKYLQANMDANDDVDLFS